MSSVIVSFLDSGRATASFTGETVMTAMPTLTVRFLHRAAEFAGETVIEASPTLTVRQIYASATLAGETNITADGHGILAGASVFRGATEITARANTRLPLITPEPILNEVAAGAFSKQYYTARLLDNLGNEIKITQASIEAPRGAVGKRVSINVAEKDLSLITNAKTYTFQIGTRETPTGAITWKPPIVENGKLNSRNFALGQNGALPADSLVFGTIEPLKNRLNKYPRENVILYNSRRTSVEISAGDVIRDTSGEAVGTNIVPINYLTLYDVLDFVRKACAFTDIITNIPNFEMTRADFPITASYLQSLSGIIGIFEPVIFTVGTVLYILDKTAAIPDEFTPRAIQNAELSNWSISIPEQAEIDGYIVSYTADETQANYYTDRLVQTTEESGDFGDDDYTRTETETTFREWRSFAAPDEILRSEIVREKRETYEGLLNLISRETDNHAFDPQGRRIRTTKTVEQLVPNLANNGVPSFQTTSEETQNVFYTTDPKNPRRSLLSRIVTRKRGMIAVDADNEYFNPDTGEMSPFRQNFIKAHEAGNLKPEMSADYGPLETKVVNYTDLGNGQYQVYGYKYDHLRKIKSGIDGEPASGDASLLSSQGKQSQIIVLKAGLTLLTRPGNALESLAIGELPLFFGIPLTERKLANRDAQKQSGMVQVIGYSDSIERGTFFTLYERQNTYVGKFITAGWLADITPMGDGCQILTSIEADEI